MSLFFPLTGRTSLALAVEPKTSQLFWLTASPISLSPWPTFSENTFYAGGTGSDNKAEFSSASSISSLPFLPTDWDYGDQTTPNEIVGRVREKKLASMRSTEAGRTLSNGAEVEVEDDDFDNDFETEQEDEEAEEEGDDQIWREEEMWRDYRIESSALDGSGRRVLVPSVSLGRRPCCLTYAIHLSRIYWIDEIDNKIEWIQSSTLSGTSFFIQCTFLRVHLRRNVCSDAHMCPEGY
ncbi:unnamed protein product [Protopolystoma xenopodis]|uniref:Uncharacterized protein n=1 Tax=Protopolystoma xenopodis TaxID=117903 RepID=A0A448X436_9PLAT|nr:unnamed protein product [Protopolystoma xenopodis]